VRPESIIRATLQNLRAGNIRSGGSTITMQIVRLSRNRERTYFQKLLEILLALKWERHLSKEEILQLYATHAPYGGNIVGLEAASYRYFGTSPENLSWSESALLAVLPNAPSLMYPGKNSAPLMKKRNRLLLSLHEEGYIDEMTLELAILEPIPETLYPFPKEAEHLLLRAREEGHRGERIITSLDRELQQKAVYVLEKHHRRLQLNRIENGACIILDTKSGNVLAYVGNTKGNEESLHQNKVDNISASRSSGSLMKPFLYALMLHEGLLLPHQLIPDYPLRYKGFIPENYHHRYEGMVPASQALTQSLNVPMVYLLSQYGVEKFHSRLKEFQLNLPYSAGHYGLTLIVGGAETGLWEMSGLFAGMGRSLIRFNESGSYFSDNYHPNRWIRGGDIKEGYEIKDSPIGAGAIWTTLEELKEVVRPNEESGWILYDSSYPIAWKTGTSWGFRDSWSIGITPEYVVGVWIGNSSGEGRPGNTGSMAAAPLLFDLVDILPATTWFKTPYEELNQVEICKESGMLKSPQCESVLIEWVPKSQAGGDSCSYHRIVHLDEDGKYRVDSSNYPVEKMGHKSWFILPPVEEWYYQYHHSDYRKLPPWMPGTLKTDSPDKIDWIYPTQNSTVSIPIEIDGSQGKVLLQAAHRDGGGEIHWFLDGDYLRTTRNFHQVEISPSPGRHTLAIADNLGDRKKATIVVE
ncbi:MAG: penicillin-binding protein 1C, partial [Spirochaetaceae bacterium]|nr:penicillin-binding protein 1C [Spirochaetaceae bacterium]